MAEGAVPADVDVPIGMIGEEERRCYYWLAKNWLSGEGCIVDAGAFIGASTFCFAAGAAAGGRRGFNADQIVHAYDYFKVIDKYVGEAISRDFRPIQEGESYLDIFGTQTSAYCDAIRAYPGDFLGHAWRGLPIEILFIDVAKTAALHDHAVGQFFPHLIPGRSVVIHQDYYHCWHPYIHYGMEYLDDEFELIDELVHHQSRLWRLIKPIPPEKITRLAQGLLSPQEKLALLDRLIEKSSTSFRPMIEVVRLWQLHSDRNVEGARKALDELEAKYPLEEGKELWARQALQIRSHIERLL